MYLCEKKDFIDMSRVFISLGTNLGNKEQHLQQAIAAIGSEVGVVWRVSGFYHSKPVGFHSDNDFLNAVLLVDSDMEPLLLLHKLQKIEKKMGRKTKSVTGYADRIIDLDILLYDNLIVNLPELKIPHPCMMERDFVLVPLREIAPELNIFKPA